MQRAYTVDQIRTAEAVPLAAGVPLMRHAAFSIATKVASILTERGFRVTGSEILLLVGGGNNGGDVLYAGAELAKRGAHVLMYLASGNVHSTALAHAQRAGVRRTELTDRALGAGVWIDGLAGIGLSGPLRPELASLITTLNAEKDGCADEPIVIAADVPSGAHADSGAVTGPVLRADYTLAFGGLKQCLLAPPACYLAGEVIEVDLDLDLANPALCTVGEGEARDLMWTPGPHDHKYTRGVPLIIAGSERYPGAGVLAAAGACGAGAGLVRMVTTAEVRAAVLAQFPEVTFGTGRYDSLLVGPGMTDCEAVRDTVEEAMGTVPVVLDAGALNLARPAMSPRVLLTPHAGELTEMLGRLGVEVQRDEIESDPLGWAQRARDLTGATVLLKGGTEIIAGEYVYAQRAPSARGATAGAGDVYAGLVATLLAQNPDEDTALVAAVASWIYQRTATRPLERASRIGDVIG